jgi:hypothetical protein
VKKIAYFIVGIVLIAVCGSVLSGAVELHNVISTNIQRFNAFPEYGSLIVLGSVLIVGASILRRRRAARSR